jgi:hypothetical protein
MTRGAQGSIVWSPSRAVYMQATIDGVHTQYCSAQLGRISSIHRRPTGDRKCKKMLGVEPDDG